MHAADKSALLPHPSSALRETADATFPPWGKDKAHAAARLSGKIPDRRAA